MPVRGYTQATKPDGLPMGGDSSGFFSAASGVAGAGDGAPVTATGLKKSALVPSYSGITFS